MAAALQLLRDEMTQLMSDNPPPGGSIAVVLKNAEDRGLTQTEIRAELRTLSHKGLKIPKLPMSDSDKPGFSSFQALEKLYGDYPDFPRAPGQENKKALLEFMKAAQPRGPPVIGSPRMHSTPAKQQRGQVAAVMDRRALQRDDVSDGEEEDEQSDEDEDGEEEESDEDEDERQASPTSIKQQIDRCTTVDQVRAVLRQHQQHTDYDQLVNYGRSKIHDLNEAFIFAQLVDILRLDIRIRANELRQLIQEQIRQGTVVSESEALQRVQTELSQLVTEPPSTSTASASPGWLWADAIGNLGHAVFNTLTPQRRPPKREPVLVGSPPATRSTSSATRVNLFDAPPPPPLDGFAKLNFQLAQENQERVNFAASPSKPESSRVRPFTPSRSVSIGQHGADLATRLEELEEEEEEEKEHGFNPSRARGRVHQLNSVSTSHRSDISPPRAREAPRTTTTAGSLLWSFNTSTPSTSGVQTEQDMAIALDLMRQQRDNLAQVAVDRLVRLEELQAQLEQAKEARDNHKAARESAGEIMTAAVARRETDRHRIDELEKSLADAQTRIVELQRELAAEKIAQEAITSTIVGLDQLNAYLIKHKANSAILDDVIQVCTNLKKERIAASAPPSSSSSVTVALLALLYTSN